MQTATTAAPSVPMKNPLREGLRLEQTPPPCAMVIFGVTGDLTSRKLMPSLYALAVDTTLSARTEGGPGTRLVGEKPTGHALGSAVALNNEIANVFAESQVYRIDHSLGKETVQTLLVFRFANGIFEPVWNRQYIDHVQMTVAENIGIEGRGKFYEEA